MLPYPASSCFSVASLTDGIVGTGSYLCVSVCIEFVISHLSQLPVGGNLRCKEDTMLVIITILYPLSFKEE